MLLWTTNKRPKLLRISQDVGVIHPQLYVLVLSEVG